jgi:hypothetical protein
MTITHQASTGINAATAQGSSSTGVAYVGVAAGRIGLLGAMVYPAANVFSAVTGFTLLAAVAGGDVGTDVSDNHDSKIGVWYREFVGDETGNVTVANTGGGAGNCTAGTMSAYSKTDAEWDIDVFVSGDDAVHGQNPSVTFGAWAAAIEPDDVIVIFHASDTDNAGVKSAFSATQTDITFDTITHRNASRSTTNSDGAVDSWDTLVLTGTNTNALTFAYSYAATSCGPFIAVRLREVAAGATDLVVQDAAQAQTADNVTITQTHELAIQDASQAQSVDNLTITQVHNIVIQDAVQTQSVDNLTIVQANELVIQDAVQTQSADNIVITQVHQLVIQDAQQTQTADNIIVSLGEIVTPSARTLIVSTESRLTTVDSESRLTTVEAESRVHVVSLV